MRRYSLGMRLTAGLIGLSMAGMVTLSGPAQGQQVGARVKAMQTKPIRELPEGYTQTLTPSQWKVIDAQRAAEKKQPDVRPLSEKEMERLQGRGSYRNKYLTGTTPWQRSIRDANVCTGNLFKSFTDVQVAPAKGAGLAMQRTYNSQDDRIGPFGIGWTHAYDLRMEEAPTTGDSTDYELSGSSYADTNFSNRSDFFGHKVKYHRDADGLYSPPPYLFDELSSDYDKFLVNGPVVPLADTEKSMDGTVKHFIKIGNERVCDSITDRYGNLTVLTYTTVVVGGVNKGLLNTVTDPSGRQLKFWWVNLGAMGASIWRISQVDSPQYSVTYAYGADQNLSGVTLDASNPASPATAVVNGPAAHTNRTMTFTYTSYVGQNGSESGLLASVTDPLGHVVSYSYSLPASNPLTSLWVTSIVEPAGVDVNNNPRTETWTIAPQAWGTGIPHDPTQFNVALSNDAGLVLTGISVDSNLRLSRLWITAYEWFYFQYDSAFNVTSMEKRTQITAGNVHMIIRSDNFTYGPHGNMLTHTTGGISGQETTAYYDASQYFMKKSVTDFNGHTTSFGIGTNTDANMGNRGSVLWVKDALYGDGTFNPTGTRFAYSYNQFGQKVSETNQNGVVTNYTFGDAWGNLTQMVQDAGTGKLNRTTSMVYDVASHVASRTDPNNKTSTVAYNNLGQPTSASFPATASTPAETISYGYGGNGRTESVSDNRGQTTLAYESNCDRVSSVTDPVTGAIGYTYGKNGERLSMTLPGGGTWTYAYSNAPVLLPKDDPNTLSMRLTSLTDDQGRRVDYTLSTMGLPAAVKFNQTFSGANLTSYNQATYYYGSGTNTRPDMLGTLNTSWSSLNGQGQWVSQTQVQNDYTYDLSGQRLSNGISDSTGLIRTEQYGYDNLNRLSSVSYGDGQTQSYSFDPMGNRLSKTDAGGGINGTENSTVNNANMLLTRGANAYTNDNNGNTLTGGGRTNTWDSQNRLVQCVYGGTTSSYVYGSDSLRHRSTVGSVTTDFVLDGPMFVRERRNNANYATYLAGVRGPEYRRDDSAGTVRWYLVDGMGSVTGEVDPNGTITSSRKYDVYGSVRGGNNPSGTSKHKFVGKLGHPSDDETGLIYMRARYYDSVTGRFISEDPAQHGYNWFAYANNNPINLYDFTGKTAGTQEDTEAAALANAYLDGAGGNAAFAVMRLAAGINVALNALWDKMFYIIHLLEEGSTQSELDAAWNEWAEAAKTLCRFDRAHELLGGQ